MNDLGDPNKSTEKTEQNHQFLEHGVYVREDDQDWGSAGMNNIDQQSDTNQ